MNDSPQSAPVVNLISKIIGQPLTGQDVSPPVIFITSVLYVLNGVIFADQSVDAEEKARLEKTITDLCPEGSQARDLAYLINENVEQQGLYHNMNNLDILTQDFSESDKLLLLSLGYEMSMADGNLDKTEKRHLKTIGTFLELDDQFHPFLESLFTSPEQLDGKILKEFKNLLDPARFHHLDEIFVVAANQILDQIPGHKKTREAKPLPRNLVDSFEELEKFKIKSYSIKGTFERIKSILDSAYQDSLISDVCMNNAENISQDIEGLEKFRIAVVGDFSQGKSTLLNVLLGEEIQPVDINPCSGTITVLRFGKEKKATCFYKDGAIEVIPFWKYQEKASLEENAAIGNPIQGLAENTVQKIIVEHPNLLFCKQGIEIIDSPGLNEHPERSIITQQLLNEVDGAIFLTDASRPMTQSEREVVNDVVSILNIGSSENSTNNLFVVVNKWDLIRKENDREKVKKRITNIFINNQLVVGENRIHYLSAQETLNSILEDKDNEYVSSFTNFIDTLEDFLGNERGDTKIKRISDKIYSLINLAITSLDDLTHILNDQSQNIESEKEELINQIGEITGRDTKIQLIANEIRDEVIDEINDSYGEWLEILPDRMAAHAENWSSEYGAIMNRDKLIADYARQFNQNLSNEFNSWISKNLKNRILKRSIREFRQAVNDELNSLENKSGHRNLSDTNSSDSFSYSFSNYNLEDVGIGGDLLFASLGLVVGVPVFIFAGPIVATIAAVLGGGSIFNAAFKALDLNDTIKRKVFEIGLENFFQSSESTDKINEIIYQLFDNEISVVQDFLQSLIAQYDSRIKIIDKKAEQDQEQNNSSIKNINQIISDLKQISFSFD
jgi:small GTP-binding protein